MADREGPGLGPYVEKLIPGPPQIDFDKSLDCRAYWLWLQQAFGEGSRLPWHIFRTFPGGLEAFARAGMSGWRELRYLTARQLSALQAFSPQQALYKLHYAQQMGWEALTPESEKYPAALRNISDPPAVLYVQGDLGFLEERPWVAVVGARKAGEEGASAARRLGHGLASAGAVVVSGIARGVDSAALDGAMAAGIPTISVLPVDLSSFGQTGPVQRARQLEMGGAMVTEYFSQPRPLQGTFHQRNRLITGMCQAVVLVQAGEKGGSMIYARHAAKQGRRLFVYPGPPEDPAFAGNRRLLAQGAQPLREGWELFEAWPELFSFPKELVEGRAKAPSPPEPPPRRAPAGKLPPLPAAEAAGGRVVLRDSGLAPKEAGPPNPARALEEDVLLAGDPIKTVLDGGPLLEPAEGEASPPPAVPKPAPAGEEERVLECLKGQSLTSEELSEAAGLDTAPLLRLLFRLEMTGRVRRGPGGQYSLN